MSKVIQVLLIFSTLLVACQASAAPGAPQIVDVHASSAAYPWLGDVYTCAPTSAAVRLTEQDTSDISLRLGEPPRLTTPAFQIGAEEILVVVHPGTTIGSLTPEDARQLFSGQVVDWTEVGGTALPVEVWTFSAEEDIQTEFDQAIMHGEPITSLARLAVSAQAMSDSVGTRPGAIGILPRRWKAGNTTDVLTVATVPVLVLTRSAPQGVVSQLIGCLQSHR